MTEIDDTTTITNAFLPPEWENKELPAPLVRICERAMQFKMEDRYSNALDITEDIRSWLDGAERKEKAMTILAQVQELEDKQIQLMNDRLEIWKQADAIMRVEGCEDENGWDLWLTASS